MTKEELIRQLADKVPFHAPEAVGAFDLKVFESDQRRHELLLSLQSGAMRAYKAFGEVPLLIYIFGRRDPLTGNHLRDVIRPEGYAHLTREHPNTPLGVIGAIRIKDSCTLSNPEMEWLTGGVRVACHVGQAVAVALMCEANMRPATGPDAEKRTECLIVTLETAYGVRSASAPIKDGEIGEWQYGEVFDGRFSGFIVPVSGVEA